MFGKFIYKYAIAIVVFTSMVCVLALKKLPYLKTEIGFNQFSLEGEEEFIRYKNFISNFGSPDHTFVLAIHAPDGIFNVGFITRLEKFKLFLESNNEITGTASLLDFKRYSQSFPGVYNSKPYINSANVKNLNRDSVHIFNDFNITQHFITQDAKWIKLFFTVKEDISLQAVDNLITKIDNSLSEFSFHTTHLLGRKYMESEFKKLMAQELKTSVLLTLAFVILILWLLFRSVKAILLPLVCMSVSLLMLYGYMAVFGRPLSIMSNLFPTIILIVGISNAIHISIKYAREFAKKQNTILAIDTTIKEIGFTTFINSITTAIGFLTLLTISMPALRSFGADAAVGLIIAWINSVLLLPALFVIFKAGNSFIRPYNIPGWRAALNWVNSLIILHPKTIVYVFILMIVISLAGITAINTDNYAITSLPKDNRLQNDYKFFDTQMGGGRIFEMNIVPSPGSYIYDKPVIEEISKLEDYLYSKMDITAIISPVLAVKWMHNINTSKTWHLPELEEDFALYSSLLANKTSATSFPIKIVNSLETTGRLRGQLKDEGRKTIENKITRLTSWINDHIDASVVQFHITGSDHVTDISHQKRIDNMLVGFLLEIIAVGLIIGLLYRSGLLILITFIANIIPILFVAGFMGFTGIELRGTTTIIFAIGYVIAVDDTLHFINRFRLEASKQIDIQEAVKKSIQHTGLPLIISSLILLGGFLVQLQSSFGDIFYHGLLISFIIIAALLTDLLLTPILLNYFFRGSSIPIKQKLLNSFKLKKPV